ncbi:galactose mutarotase-like protein [Haematococcus lacustris]
MQRITLRSEQGSSAEVVTHGAHVVSWKNSAGEELLFVSEKAIFAPPKAIRGGVPLCFPQFGMMGPMPSQHGFARNVAFSVVEQEPWRVKLALEYDGSSQPAFPHPFTLHVIISICDNHLLQELVVLNTGPSPLTFTAALHTYIRVTDIHTAKVRGLSQGRYLDNLASLQQSTQEEEELGFSGEVDRVYLSTPSTIQVIDPSGKRIVTVSKEGFPDAIVWNPWIAKAASMADFGDEEYKVMICIEPAVAGSGPVTLEPGAEWQGKQDLAYQSSSA